MSQWLVECVVVDLGRQCLLGDLLLKGGALSTLVDADTPKNHISAVDLRELDIGGVCVWYQSGLKYWTNEHVSEVSWVIRC